MVTSRDGALTTLARQYDFLLDAVSAPHNVNAFLELLRPQGTLVMVGAPPKAHEIQGFSLIMGNRRLAGSLIGGIRETQEMLDYCAKKKVYPDVEVIAATEINAAYERVVKGDVRYRFVIDAKTY